jgi:hypothetical protein
MSGLAQNRARLAGPPGPPKRSDIYVGSGVKKARPPLLVLALLPVLDTSSFYS